MKSVYFSVYENKVLSAGAETSTEPSQAKKTKSVLYLGVNIFGFKNMNLFQCRITFLNLFAFQLHTIFLFHIVRIIPLFQNCQNSLACKICVS